jgi:hypothetical protein
LEEEGGAVWWQVNGVELYRAVFDLRQGRIRSPCSTRTWSIPAEEEFRYA